ncbi:MAG: ABC transporter substrate-binding protein [Deltaproteobacteria bacterium]|nr:ABC transporter substrate-binding protein [Deltaproteobacteria bacterium]
MSKKRKMCFFSALVFFFFIPLTSASAEVGVTDNEIVIGTIQAMTGGMAYVGNQNVRGTKAMVAEINKKGGILGRKIRQIVMDDAYRTDRHVANARRMISQDKIFCFVFNLGTPTVLASRPLLNQYKVPLYGAATQSKLLDNEPLIFSDAASYRQLCIQGIKYMMQTEGCKKIGVFYLDNPFGEEHLAAAREYLKAIGSKPVAEEKFKMDDYDVSSQATRLKKAGADCIVIAATPPGVAKILKAAHGMGYYPKTIGPLMCSNPGFIKVAGKDAEGIFIMLPFKAPNRPELKPYRDLAKSYYPDKHVDNMMIAGMTNVVVFAEACKRAGKDLTRKNFIKAVETISEKNIDLPYYKGADFYYSKDRHRASSSIIIGQIKDGKVVEATDWINWENMPVPELEKK